MAADVEGAAYEKAIIRILRSAIRDNKDIKLAPARSRSSSDSTTSDVTLKLFNSYSLHIELKKDARAQMGGGSYNYAQDYGAGGGTYKESSTTKIDKGINEEYIKILNSKRVPLNRIIDYVKENETIPELSKKAQGLPITVTAKVWEKAKSKGLLIPLNTYVKTNTEFVYNHYRRKNCYYIQIGGRGFYYLKSNPLNLPIPQLRGNLTVELRLGASGQRMNTTHKTMLVGANIRAQGRLGGDYDPSPFTLENADDYDALFGKLTKNDASVLAGL